MPQADNTKLSAAGSDSTASTMQSFVWHVLSDPSIHERLSAEISQAHFSNSGVVGFKEAQDLPYFQACLKEAMRMKPAVGFNITRNVPPSGASINGTWIPGGTQVAVNAWVMHRDEEVFGADAKYFNPERWLKDGERAKVMERCMFQVGVITGSIIVHVMIDHGKGSYPSHKFRLSKQFQTRQVILINVLTESSLGVARMFVLADILHSLK